MFRISYSNHEASVHVSAWTDVVIIDDKRNLVFMSVAGSDSAVKALVAVTHGTHARYFQIEDQLKTGKLKGTSAHVEGNKRFRSMTSKIGDLTHGIVISEDAIAETESENPIVIAWDGDMAKAFYETLVAKYPVPLLPEWSAYLFNESVKRDYVENLYVSSTDKPILAARLTLDQEKLETIVKDGFKSGLLFIPEGQHDGGELSEIKDVTGYLNSYGTALANRLGDVFKPYHKPGIDELDPKLNLLYRKPFRAQADVAMGIAKALQSSDKTLRGSNSDRGISSIYNNKGAIIVGEMGAGKTILGITVAHLIHDSAYRVIVMAPGHLVKKWKREVEITVPNAKGIILHDFKEVLDLKRLVGTEPTRPEFYIISRDRAKLGYFTRCAAKWVDVRPSRGAMVVKAHRTGWECPVCGELQMVKKDDDMVPAEYEDFLKMKSSNKKCSSCGSKLWSADNKKVKRAAPADLLKKYFKGFFDLFLADEIHELKGATAQGNAFGALYGISKKTIGLTGTLMGGYASNLFRILFRMNPRALLSEDINYNSEAKWVGRYGILEKTFKRTEEESNRMSRGGKGKTTVKEKPGVSPQVFTRFLLPSCAFLELADLSEHLPPYTELIEMVEMDEELEDAYNSLANKLKQELDEQLRLGKKGLLGTYLNTLLLYPDRPFGNDEIVDQDGDVIAVPPELPCGETYAKERRLLEIVLSEKKKGRRSMVYAQFTGKKDVQVRLAEILREQGLKVEILRSSVKPENRESWVAEKVRKGVDVIITNPKLVETGLDLLDFPSIIFFETGYNLFTLRQASRRSWRIGQKIPVRVYFMCYQDTLQEAALRLMGSKLEASMSLEGKFSEEGLRSMGEGLDLSSALAKALVEGMEGVDSAESIWSRMGYGTIAGSDDDEEVPEITRVNNEGEVELVKVVLVNRTSRKKKDQEAMQYGWDFFAEGA